MKPAVGRVESQIRSIFPDNAIEQVQVLEYGDDPEVEPGDTVIRAFIPRSNAPEGEEADEDIVSAFELANRESLKRLRDRLPRFVGWVEFRPEGTGGVAAPHGPVLRIARGGRAKSLDDGSEQLTSVMTRLGSADLATVDTLITAGVANSRAEVLRWAVGRIRENPAYARLQERVQEISELKAQF